MLFVARAAIKLRDDFLNQRHDEWNDIKSVGTIEYKWRLCEDLAYEVTAGFFEKYDEALACAKQFYVSLLYYALRNGICIKNAGCQRYNPNLFVEGLDGDRDAFLENEEFFLWKNQNGGNYGPSVIEVEKDYEELSTHQIIPLDVSVEWQSMDLAIEDIDKYVFSYTREAQRLLSIVVLADQTSSIGMKMTMYCALLEHLSPNRKKGKKREHGHNRPCSFYRRALQPLNGEKYSDFINHLTRKNLNCILYLSTSFCVYPKFLLFISRSLFLLIA